MNQEERIIEVTGYSKRTPITWLKDPTRHLLKSRPSTPKTAATTTLNRRHRTSLRKTTQTIIPAPTKRLLNRRQRPRPSVGSFLLNLCALCASVVKKSLCPPPLSG